MPDGRSWGGRDQVPMPFSLGPLGDMVWVFLPDCRPAIIAILTHRLTFDMESNEPIQRIAGYDFLDEAVNPVVRMALSTRDDEVAGRALSFLWMVLTYRGIDWGAIQYDVKMYVLEWLMLPPYRDILRAYDAGLEDYICSSFGSEW